PRGLARRRSVLPLAPPLQRLRRLRIEEFDSFAQRGAAERCHIQSFRQVILLNRSVTAICRSHRRRVMEADRATWEGRRSARCDAIPLKIASIGRAGGPESATPPR